MHKILFSKDDQVTLVNKLEAIEAIEMQEYGKNGVPGPFPAPLSERYSRFVDVLFKEFPDLESTLHHAATGCATEGGEILDNSKKAWAHGKPIDVLNLVEELGDQLFYMQKIMNMLGLTIADIQRANMHKLMQRYPSGKYSDADAQARLDKV